MYRSILYEMTVRCERTFKEESLTLHDGLDGGWTPARSKTFMMVYTAKLTWWLNRMK